MTSRHTRAEIELGLVQVVRLAARFSRQLPRRRRHTARRGGTPGSRAPCNALPPRQPCTALRRAPRRPVGPPPDAVTPASAPAPDEAIASRRTSSVRAVARARSAPGRERLPDHRSESRAAASLSSRDRASPAVCRSPGRAALRRPAFGLRSPQVRRVDWTLGACSDKRRLAARRGEWPVRALSTLARKAALLPEAARPGACGSKRRLAAAAAALPPAARSPASSCDARPRARRGNCRW